MNRAPELARLVAFYEGIALDSLRSQLEHIYAPDAQFKDPFNEVRGIAPIVAIFEHMFVQVDQPRQFRCAVHKPVTLWISQKYSRYGSRRASRMLLVKRFGK